MTFQDEGAPGALEGGRARLVLTGFYGCCFLACPGGRQPLSFFASPGGQSLALLPMVLPLDDEDESVDEPLGDVAVLGLVLVLPEVEPDVLPVLPSVVPVLLVPLADGLVLLVDGAVLLVEGVVLLVEGVVPLVDGVVLLVEGVVPLVEPVLPIVEVLLPAEPGVTIAPPLDGRAPLVLAPGPVVTLVSFDSVPLLLDDAPDWAPALVLLLADCA
jgi:hypothetical protein